MSSVWNICKCKTKTHASHSHTNKFEPHSSRLCIFLPKMITNFYVTIIKKKKKEWLWLQTKNFKMRNNIKNKKTKLYNVWFDKWQSLFIHFQIILIILYYKFWKFLIDLYVEENGVRQRASERARRSCTWTKTLLDG